MPVYRGVPFASWISHPVLLQVSHRYCSWITFGLLPRVKPCWTVGNPYSLQILHLISIYGDVVSPRPSGGIEPPLTVTRLTAVLNRFDTTLSISYVVKRSTGTSHAVRECPVDGYPRYL